MQAVMVNERIKIPSERVPEQPAVVDPAWNMGEIKNIQLFMPTWTSLSLIL